MRIVLAALVGAAIVFMCGFVSWTVLQLHESSTKSLPAENTFFSSFKQAGLEEGVYLAPAEGKDKKVHEEKLEAGPLVFLAYRPGGWDGMGEGMAKGFAISLLAALFVAIVLNLSRNRNFFGRWFIVISMGAFLALAGDGNYWNWFWFASDWSIAMALDHLASWSIAGFFMAMIVKPETA